MSILDKLNGSTFKKLHDRWYTYPSMDMNDEFWWLRSEDLVVIASPPNMWKTTFVYKILEDNSHKGTAMVNMEFNLENGFRYEFFRSLWYASNRIKKIWTDEMPMTEQESMGLARYIKKRRECVDIHTMKQKAKLPDVMDKFWELARAGKEVIALDSLTSINGVWDSLWLQIEAMQEMRNFCEETGIVVILIHHFNKEGKSYSGSGKIRDLASVLMEIVRLTDNEMRPYRLFILKKDKAIAEEKELHQYFVKWEYVSVPKRSQWERK